MYAGPGSSSMLAAASAWDGLAAELRSTALSYGTITSELADDTWRGPSSAAMEDAVTPYVAWLNSAAEEAEQTAGQARSAASAYQTAFSAMVPPEVILLNREQLAMLNATNVFGQNTPAISTVEAQYGEMWAQDAAAMYGYAGNSATSARLTAFTTPPSTTNPAGTANQSAATAQAVGTSSAGGVQSALSQLVSTVPNSLQSLASPASSTSASTSLSTTLTNLLNSLTSSSTAATTSTGGLPGLDSTTIMGDVYNYIGLFALFMGLDAMGPLMGTPIANSITQAMAPVAAAAAPAAAAAAAPAAVMGGAAGGFAGGAGGFAGLGSAASVGALSVPQSWGTAATPTWFNGMQLATPLPGISAEVGEGMPFGLPVLPGGLGGAAGAAAAAGVGGAVASRYGPRLKVLSRSPGAGYSPGPMAPAAGGYGPPAGLPPAPGYTPHIVYLPNNGQNGHTNGHNGHTNGHNGHNGYNGYTNGNSYNGHNNGNGPN